MTGTPLRSFEITIRLLGGLLSSYQLTGDERLLTLADELGRRLLPVFRSPTGIPYVDVNLKTGAVRNSRTNPGEAGTLRIEFGTLSKLTGKSEYYAAAKNAVQQIYNRRSPIGLVGTWIDAETGTWLDPDSHLSACIDSYYEYMVKCEILFGDEDLGRMWESSIVAVNTHLAHETGSGLWYGHAEHKSVVSKEKNDRMESYFLAETLKYLYLLYAPPEALDFRTTVFNTEAHPIRRTW